MIRDVGWLGTVAACLALTVGGCKRDEVTRAVVPKAPPQGMPGMPPVPGMGNPPPAGPPGQPPAAPGAPMAGEGMGAGTVPPPPSDLPPLKWTLPKGWTESRTGGMRFATIKPPTQEAIEVSVVVLPGPAGGELANVNRWRGQIGLPPADEQALAKERQVLKSKAGGVLLYDLVSDGQVKSRMLAAMLSTAEGNTWFLKMAGNAPALDPYKADFIHLLESLSPP